MLIFFKLSQLSSFVIDHSHPYKGQMTRASYPALQLFSSIKQGAKIAFRSLVPVICAQLSQRKGWLVKN